MRTILVTGGAGFIGNWRLPDYMIRGILLKGERNGSQ